MRERLSAEVISERSPMRTARWVWRTVVLATQTPLTRVLPTPQPAAINLIIPSRTDFLKLHNHGSLLSHDH